MSFAFTCGVSGEGRQATSGLLLGAYKHQLEAAECGHNSLKRYRPFPTSDKGLVHGRL